jgi:hypothetical protein
LKLGLDAINKKPRADENKLGFVDKKRYKVNYRK